MHFDEQSQRRPFIDARDFVRGLKLLTSRDYSDWSAAGLRPPDIPVSPDRDYDEWEGWADWLGTGPARVGNRPRKRAPFLPFEEARLYARSLGFRNQTQWFDRVRERAKPDEIPADPSKSYRGKGWQGWPDWLGYAPARATGQELVRPFREAREYVRTLGLKGYRQWWVFADSPERPSDIPKSPDCRYRDDGWIGWGDWLGQHTRWNHKSIIAFLGDLKPVLENLQPIELYLILRQNGMLRLDRRNRQSFIVGMIENLCRPEGARAEAFEKIAGVLVASQTDPEPELKSVDDGGGRQDFEADLSEVSCEGVDEFRRLKNLDGLKVVDGLVDARLADDTTVLDFFVENRVADLWQKVISGDPEFALEKIRAEDGGEHFRRIQREFLDQFDRVRKLGLPDGYGFCHEGRLVEPNLMQRLTAYRLLTEKRIGNWSGVGSGKTLAALYSAGIVGARFTIVVVVNATVKDWSEKVIPQTFPDAAVFVKGQWRRMVVPEDRPTFYVTNYESFQQDWTEELVSKLTSRRRVDFIVLDEVQNVRHRSAAKEISLRRESVKALLDGALTANPDLRVLGMSATPVVNNLHEAKTLLEMVTGREFPDVSTGTTVANAVQMHQLLVRHGIRHRPPYSLELDTTLPILDGILCVPQLRAVKRGDVLGYEHALLQAKLDYLTSLLGSKSRSRTRTMIYTHYVGGGDERSLDGRSLIGRVADAVRAAGFTVGEYSGRSKEGIEAFLRKKDPVDVLIGSAPLGTGVDGLQYVCNRLVILSLPWSNAEYEQVVGRLWRQKSEFTRVEVIIPQVVLRNPDAGFWSWDDQRYRCIMYKKTLADAALDGVIPGGSLPSKAELQRRSAAALDRWIARVEKGDSTSPPAG